MEKRRFALVWLVAVALAAAGAVAQESAEDASPRMVVPELISDFGQVAQGKVVDATFEVRNEGSAGLVIKAVRPTCGCTVAEFDKEIGPGASGEVRTKLDTTGFKGPISKSVLVITNDPETPTVSLVLKARVEPFVDVLPRPLVRFSKNNDQDVTETVKVVSGLLEDFKVTGVDTSVPYLKTELRPLDAEERLADKHANQYELAITLDKTAPLGPISAEVTVHTDSKEAPDVPIKVFGVVRALVQVTPTQIQFGSVDPGLNPARNVIVVNNREGSTLKVTGAEVNDAAFVAQVTPVVDGQRYQVMVAVKPEAASGARDALLTISTTDPDYPQVTVPVRANLK